MCICIFLGLGKILVHAVKQNPTVSMSVFPSLSLHVIVVDNSFAVREPHDYCPIITMPYGRYTVVSVERNTSLHRNADLKIRPGE